MHACIPRNENERKISPGSWYCKPCPPHAPKRTIGQEAAEIWAGHRETDVAVPARSRSRSPLLPRQLLPLQSGGHHIAELVEGRDARAELRGEELARGKSAKLRLDSGRHPGREVHIQYTGPGL
jgi:hypothetical protein